jgi:hypothetical protein
MTNGDRQGACSKIDMDLFDSLSEPNRQFVRGRFFFTDLARTAKYCSYENRSLDSWFDEARADDTVN